MGTVKGFAMLKIGSVGWIEKDEKELTPLGPRDAYCRPVVVAPCTSDLHTVYEGGIGERHDMFLGHESVAEILEVGKDVKDFKPGDIVIVPAITPDWGTINAQRGFAQHSGRLLSDALGGWKFSNFKDGVFASKFHVNDVDANVAKVPEGVDIEDAVILTDMVTTGFHCAENAEIKHGESVAVIGLGPVGLMATAGANLMGASHIYAVDAVDDRYEIAHKHYGATHYVNFKNAPFQEQIIELTKGVGVDKVLVAGGDLTTIGAACDCLKNGGIVSNVNYLGKGEFITIPRLSWNVGMGHKTIKGGLTPGGRYRMETLASLLQTKKLNVRPLMTNRLSGFSEIETALAIMKDKPKGLIKPTVKITW
ncbi:NAD(P)-dependent alcohol dehydrogenase [Helicobacter sp. 13S00401-1]|uniref:NAD(P)-dependent alcohol dehydrogenase n=1 Tax=Helicobacter sp. 13S00401-1 TaxID=1905758 RepID=UPI000BA70D7E|nr:NAD(P)-dependent alcohol dehydrogenase [Helicobacter sp. 13S00401-1]PAF50335.1 NAD(P)-dependent alcohol dehydrogenase [Helicobacter sp. 13S00401-1]